MERDVRGKKRANQKAMRQYVDLYCERYAGQIAVRERDLATGQWRSFFLSELPKFMRKRHVQRWRNRMQCPNRVSTPDEVVERDLRNSRYRRKQAVQG